MLLHRSQVRLLRFWEARNVRRRGGEVMGVDILLQDSQATMMSVTVNVNRLAAHRPNLKAGSIYSLTGFDLTRFNQNYARCLALPTQTLRFQT
ncbi:hypothetical protein YC2023_076916 [Brassica napus]